MNHVDRDPALDVHLVTDYVDSVVAVDGDKWAAHKRALIDLELERDIHLDITHELSQAIRRIKTELRAHGQIR